MPWCGRCSIARHRVFATRVLHALLRGVSRDRLDLLGEEYFHYLLKPQLKPRGVAQAAASGWLRTGRSCWSARGWIT